jgi:hypothetical protein
MTATAKDGFMALSLPHLAFNFKAALRAWKGLPVSLD